MAVQLWEKMTSFSSWPRNWPNWKLGNRGCFKFSSRRGGEELGDAVGDLGTIAGPVVDAVALEDDRGGLGAGVVGSDHFDGTTVAGAILFDDNDAVMGLLTGANARQTNHQHRVDPLRKSLDGFRVAVTCTGDIQMG